MKQIRHPRLRAGLFSAMVVAVATAAQLTGVAGPQASDAPVPAMRCEWTVDQLPRTPDAVEGWYRGCPRSVFPGTPDAVEAWRS